MMRNDDPNLRVQWLMSICAAFAMAIMLMLGMNGCAADEGRGDESGEVEVSGGELPEYEEAEPSEIEREARTEVGIGTIDDRNDLWWEDDLP